MKTKSLPQLEKQLDTIFSRFIRLRDSDDNGWVRCISCGTPHNVTDIDCGHFIKRGKLSTRFHEKNCNGQCRGCNRYKNGNEAMYSYHLNQKWGAGTSDLLVMLSSQPAKYSRFDYEIMIKEYKAKVKKLKEEKGL